MFWSQPSFLCSRTLIKERVELADGGRLADPELLAAPVVVHPGDKCCDNLVIAGVYHTMGKLTEALHKAAQLLL
jgi:hypothetical protein